MALRERILSASTRRSNVNAAAGMMVGKRDKASAASIKPISLLRQSKASDALAINWQTGKPGNSSRVWLVDADERSVGDRLIRVSRPPPTLIPTLRLNALSALCFKLNQQRNEAAELTLYNSRMHMGGLAACRSGFGPPIFR